jgi:hypothetical protein
MSLVRLSLIHTSFGLKLSPPLFTLIKAHAGIAVRPIKAVNDIDMTHGHHED